MRAGPAGELRRERLLDGMAAAEGATAEKWRKVDRAKLLTRGRNFKGETIFASLPKATLRRIAAKMELRAFEPGATIVRQGEVGDAMYIVLEGRCSVTWEDQPADAARTLIICLFTT